MELRGAGKEAVTFYLTPDFANVPGNQGNILTTNAVQSRFGGFTVDGLQATYPSFVAAVSIFGGDLVIEDIRVQQWVFHTGSQNAGIRLACNNCSLLHSTVENSNTACLIAGSSGFTWVKNICANSVVNLWIDAIAPAENGTGLRMFGGTVDEGGSLATTITASKDVSIFGTTFLGAAGGTAVSVDGTSEVKFFGSYIGPYAANPNVTGLSVLAAGKVWLSACRLAGTGTGFALDNAGTVFDAGGNTIPNRTGAGSFIGGDFLYSLSLKANTAFRGMLTHANTADRSYTLPDVTGNMPVLPTAATAQTGSGAIVRQTSPSLASPTFSTGVGANGSGFKHGSVATGPVAAGARAEVTLAWTTAFADANYNVTCDLQDSATLGTAQGLIKERIRQVTESKVSVVVFNPTASALTGTVLCAAVHP